MAGPKKPMSFYETITAAIKDMAEHGYDSQERLNGWLESIAAAVARDMTPPHVMERMLRESLTGIYRKMVDGGQILQKNPGVSQFTLEKVKPHLRAELDRRIMAAANLIVLNRQAMIQKTLQRFSGWSTSIPIGGSDAVDKNAVKKDLKKALARLPFESRRVLIDQGHKFTSALNEIIASDGGALAGRWHSHWRQTNYDYREDHKERDEEIYAVRGNWALAKGLMKAGKNGYTDDITKPGEEIFCRCFYEYIYNLRDLPPDMLTQKGAAALAEAKRKAAL